MIQLICTQCRAMLEMDDGFAGGACRCRHCGTIQTVPSHLKQKNGAGKSRTLYKTRPENIAVPSSGLDQLADVVASSGLTSSRLRKPPEASPPVVQQKNLRTLLIVSGSIIVLLSGALIFALTRGTDPHGGPERSAGPRSSELATAVAVASTPAPSSSTATFCGIPLEGETIIYCLDRGDSARDTFSELKSATLRSIASLGPDRKFQIVFWNNGSDQSFPATWPTPLTPTNLTAAEKALEQISPHGKTDVSSALKKAIAGDPSEIVLVTAKAWDLDDAFVSTIDQIRGEKPVKVHTISLGDPRTSTALQTIAAQTRGTFKACSKSDLKDAVR